MGGVISALNFMHEELRLVHADVKPHNMLVNDSMTRIWLADFGTSGGESLIFFHTYRLPVYRTTSLLETAVNVNVFDKVYLARSAFRRPVEL